MKYLISIILLMNIGLSQNITMLEKRANNGDVDAQYDIAVMYLSGQEVERDIHKGIKWLKTASENGNIYAQTRLGVAYLQGIGVRQNNEEALKWLEQASSHGYLKAYTMLGIYYTKAEINYPKALDLFKTASDFNEPLAQYFLGEMYYSGMGVQKNLDVAKEYFGKACDNGDQNGCDEYRKLNN